MMANQQIPNFTSRSAYTEHDEQPGNVKANFHVYFVFKCIKPSSQFSPFHPAGHG